MINLAEKLLFYRTIGCYSKLNLDPVSTRYVEHRKTELAIVFILFTRATLKIFLNFISFCGLWFLIKVEKFPVIRLTNNFNSIRITENYWTKDETKRILGTCILNCVKNLVFTTWSRSSLFMKKVDKSKFRLKPLIQFIDESTLFYWLPEKVKDCRNGGLNTRVQDFKPRDLTTQPPILEYHGKLLKLDIWWF